MIVFCRKYYILHFIFDELVDYYFLNMGLLHDDNSLLSFLYSVIIDYYSLHLFNRILYRQISGLFYKIKSITYHYMFDHMGFFNLVEI
jgi:hypothetical protein